MPLGRGEARGVRRPVRVARSARGFWRTGLAALVVLGVCMWQLVFAATPGAGADDSTWVAGTATATAQAIALAPSTAGLNYAVTLATSVADYQANEGQAESEIFTGGPVVTSLTTTQCDGSAPLVTQSQLPQPAVAESTNGNQSQSSTINAQYAHGASVPGLGTGLEQALATTQPAANTVTKLSDLNVPGAFDISGAQSTAYAQQVTDKLRQATSTVDIASLDLGNGAVDLQGLHWEDTQETGPGGTVLQQGASFAIAGVSIAGVTVPSSVLSTDTLAQLPAIVNTALEGTGLHVTLPSVSTNSEGTEIITPLSVGIDQSALGQQVVGPLLGQTETVRDEIDTILEQDISCKTGVPVTVVDIVLGALSGGGNLDLNLGGATATSNGTAYANPFGSSIGLLSDSGSPGSSDLTPPFSIPGEPGSYTPGTPGTPATGGSGGAPSKEALGSLASSERCVTTSPFGHPGCSSGAGVPVALAGLGVLLGVGAADFVRARRYRRLAPTEVEQ